MLLYHRSTVIATATVTLSLSHVVHISDEAVQVLLWQRDEAGGQLHLSACGSVSVRCVRFE